MRLWLAAALTAGTFTVPADMPASGPAPGRPPGLAFASSGHRTAALSPGNPSGRQAEFAAAAREFGVPESVLLGVSYLESRWDVNGGSPSTAGGYGPMHLVDAFPADALSPLAAAAPSTGDAQGAHASLSGDPHAFSSGGGHAWPIGDALGDARGDDARPMPRTFAEAPPTSTLSASAPPTTLPEAGRLIGADPALLRTDPAANIRGGAALLASYQDRPSGNPADWYAAVARYSGAEDAAAAREFADEVFSVMREGARRRTDDGHLVRLEPVPNLPHPVAATAKDPATSKDPAASTHPATAKDSGAVMGPVTAKDSADVTGSTSVTGEQAETRARRDPAAPPAANERTDNDPPPPYNDPFDTDALPFSGEETWTDDQTDPDENWAEPGNVEKTGNGGQVECPSSLACEWIPAAYERFGRKKHRDYGNHDRLSRSRSIDYIVIHDTEGSYQGVPSLIRNPRYVSWHYTIRSRDGHVAQHVATNDIAWHAGNWDVNTRSIGIEHEGYLAKGTWYTEAMYRSSAKLVRYLAGKYRIPLNRAHILGHDNVPGTTPKMVAGMHEDPGPYWDWSHYFDLLGKPLKGVQSGNSIMIRPSYATNRPRFTGCVAVKPDKACPPHGAATVWLHQEPRESSPLVNDPGKHPGKPSTYSVYDHSARASTGQRYAVADRQGDWTAIWYLGQKAWFHNPPSNPTAVPARGPLVTPLRPGTRVYGRAYPEQAAYKLASYQQLAPLQYRIGPSQTYTVGDTITGSYYSAGAFSAAKHVTTTGQTRYYQIQLGHRVMFVMAKDVRLIR
ncbi:N-acetylmuramoyl-L-alanine amidase [Nonomuraea angiospora]|uniref:N-acetylmuramoyl-L-alanine amidase n=1 Tax=Nonomuraea angiospora TaxID=46172 RepID=UPI00342FF28D